MNPLRSAIALLVLSLCAAPVHAGEGEKYIGKPLQQWLDALESKDAKAREDALATLAKIGRPAKEALPKLTELLKDESVNIRFGAALALWSVGGDGKEAWPLIQGMVKTLKPNQKYQITGLVESLKPIDSYYLDALLELQKDSFVASAASFTLNRIDESAIPAYEKFLDNHAKNRVAALNLVPFKLVQASKGKLLAKYLKDDDLNVRAIAAGNLAYVPETKADAVPVLVELGKSDKEEVAERAIRALAGIQPPLKEAEDIFRSGLAHKNVKLRIVAATPYAQLRPDDAAAVLPVIEGAMRTFDPLAQNEAMALIRRLGPKAEPLVPVLLKMLREPKLPNDPHNALIALASFREQAAKDVAAYVFDPKADPNRPFSPALRSYALSLTEGVKSHLAGENVKGRVLATRIASQFLPPGEIAKVVPELTGMLKSDDSNQVKVTLNALKVAGPQARSASEEVLALLDRKDAAALNRSIRETLHEIRPEPALIEKALKKLDAKEMPTFADRFIAAELASQLPDEGKALASRVSALLGDPGFRRESQLVYQFLTQVGPNLAASVPALHEHLKKFPGDLEWFGPALVRIGPAAKEIAPLFLDKTKTALNTQLVLKLTAPMAALDPVLRPEADRRLNELFLEHLKKHPGGSEVGYFLHLLREYMDRSGPSKELEPLLLEIFRTRGDARFGLAKHVIDVNPAHRDVVLKTLVADLDNPPSNSKPISTLLKVSPDHPGALERLARILKEVNFHARRGALLVALEAGVNLPTIRPLLESMRKDDPSRDNRLLAAVALMKFDNKLDAETVDDLFARAEDPAVGSFVDVFETVANLGSLARPLIPRLKSLARDDVTAHRVERVIERIEASR